MSFNLYFISGWAFNKSFWIPTSKILLKQENINSAAIVDLNTSIKRAFQINDSKKNIFITHSIGLNHFLKNKINSCALINFFSAPNFFEFQENIKLAKKSFYLMLKGFDENPKNVLKIFFKNCGLINHDIFRTSQQTQQLKSQLVNIKNDNFINDFEKLPQRVLTLFSDSDKIFRASEEKLNKIEKHNHTVRKISGATHAFPLIHPKATSKIINEFIDYEL